MRTITAEEHLAVIRDRAKPSGGSPGQVGQLPADPRVGGREAGVEGRVHRLGLAQHHRRRVAGGSRARPLPPAAQDQALPRLPARGPAGRLGERGPPRRGWTRWPTTCETQGAFGIRIGPPVVTRRWSAAQVKEGIADESVRSLTSLPPTERSQVGAGVVSQLQDLGWRAAGGRGGLRRRPAAVQLPHPAHRRRGHSPQRGRRPQGHEPAVAPQHQEGREAGRRGRARRRHRPQGLPRALRAHRRPGRLHPAAAELLRDHVRGAPRRGAGPDPGLPRPPRGRPGGEHDLDPRRGRTRGTPTAPPPPRSATSAGPTRSSGR